MPPPGHLDNLARISEMLLAKGSALPDFLRSDARRRLIPDCIANLAQDLAGQRQATLLELDLLMKNTEHIKKIISMQQNYARVTGLAEPLPPDLLVEESAGISRGATFTLEMPIAQLEAAA